jgi:hypothetical protein
MLATVPDVDDTLAAPGEVARTATVPGSARAHASAELEPGLRLGHFRIDRRLGAGGMGEVYLATDLALDRPVAVKLLPPGAASGAAHDRLIREARAQARINHPNVAHIYFVGEDAGRLYFAMEYIAGETLGEKIANAPMAIEDALAAIRAAVLGLREAQRLGFTHRDVKPSNLMIDGNGIVKVVDFGLVAATTSETHGGPVAQTSLGGTPLYMAPEQAAGGAIDFRADIYALGATLYHLVSGRPPFQADSAAELITLHASAARPALPRGTHGRIASATVNALVARMMAPKPEDRFASYDDLLRAIEIVSTQHTRPAGFWVRTIAMSIDFTLIMLPVALGCAAIGIEGVSGTLGFAVTALYLTLAISRWGMTIGKALFELEVVAIDTASRPSLFRSAKRELALVGVPLAINVAADILKQLDPKSLTLELVKIAGPVSVLVLFFLLAYASIRTPGKRAPWDRASGTMVRYRTRRGTATAPA